MKTILTAQAAKANDLYTINSRNRTEQDLISSAAYAVFNTLQTEGYDLRTPCVLCGGGNNGADGLQLACLLKQAGSEVTVLYLGALYSVSVAETKKSAKKATDAYNIDPALLGTPKLEAMSEQCRYFFTQVQAANIPVLTTLPAEALLSEQPAYSVIVDAVYGTGLNGAITDRNVCSVFDQINLSSIPVVAIDIPSGAHCDTGALDAHALYAGQTVCMQDLKPAHVLFPAAGYAGVLTVADIGIEADPLLEAQSSLQYIQETDLDTLLPARPARANKGTFGRVLVIAGSLGMAGAAYLAAMAAYRAGAGLVEILTTSKNRTVLQQLIPEAIITCYTDKSKLKKALKTSLPRADAVVLGCGLGSSKLAQIAVKYVLGKAKVPVVIDADALNIIAKKNALLKGVSKKKKSQIIITPHPVEAARLLGRKTTADALLANLPGAIEQLCNKYKVNVLLKDARSLIYSHDKNTRYVNLTGSTALAGAGSGDILAGLIGGLCASKTNALPTATSAALAAYLHGKAGEAAEQKVGARAAMARDILDALKK